MDCPAPPPVTLRITVTAARHFVKVNGESNLLGGVFLLMRMERTTQYGHTLALLDAGTHVDAAGRFERVFRADDGQPFAPGEYRLVIRLEPFCQPRHVKECLGGRGERIAGEWVEGGVLHYEQVFCVE